MCDPRAQDQAALNQWVSTPAIAPGTSRRQSWSPECVHWAQETGGAVVRAQGCEALMLSKEISLPLSTWKRALVPGPEAGRQCGGQNK
jgi:hypothetical protein